jgi:hypothetical protein
MERPSVEAVRMRWWCYERVYALDRMKIEGRFADEESYQKALGRIRDYGVMRGLKAKDIRIVFSDAHAQSGYVDVHPREQATDE